ncbi:hypothetical protein L1887_35301 [Cichorium endivia]|nr:hypothetical protein L1887_35301 [Cichorium endivia]
MITPPFTLPNPLRLGILIWLMKICSSSYGILSIWSFRFFSDFRMLLVCWWAAMVPVDGAYEGSKAAYKNWVGCLMEDGTSASILPSEFVRLGHRRLIQKGSHKVVFLW